MQSDGLCQVEHVKVGSDLSGLGGIAFPNQKHICTYFVLVKVWLSSCAELASVMHRDQCHGRKACY